ncbi:sulfatase [Porticoccaceae bacterium]|nr:sulfatase [Porticoccaceae bacterium]
MPLRFTMAMLCLALALPATSVLAQQRPNILLIMAEDMSARVGVFGDNVAVTPNLDRLASTSVRYPNTFTTAGVCAPSRAAHILAVHQMATGAQHMRSRSFKESAYRSVPPAHIKAYPELLRLQGYYTFTSSKLDYQFSNTSAGSGPFSIWDYEGAQPTWQGRAEGQPFFGFVTLTQSHERQMFPNVVVANNAAGTRTQVVNPDEVIVPPYYPDHPAIRRDIAQHYNNIFAMDQTVGKLLRQLEQDGLADNTIVIWTTDHGDGLPRAKREIYDSGIKVPLIVHWPKSLKPAGLNPGSIDKKLVSFVDIGPSVLTIAAIPVPDYMHGSAQLVPNASPERDYIYAAKDRLDGFNFRERGVRDGQFKYINNLLPNMPGAQHIAYRDKLATMQVLWQQFAAGKLNAAQRFWFQPRPAEELYDIVADPHEINNLVDSAAHAATLARMRSALLDWRGSIIDYSETAELEMAKDFWPNGDQPVTQAPDISINIAGTASLAPAAVNDSVGYRVNGGAWKLYSKPLSLPKNAILEAKSVRYGWAESRLKRASYNASD